MHGGQKVSFLTGTPISETRVYYLWGKGTFAGEQELKGCVAFNVLSFMSNELLTQGNAAASLDEFYLFLSNPTAVEYVRNFSKRVEKGFGRGSLQPESGDFSLDGIQGIYKAVVFNPDPSVFVQCRDIDAKFYTDTLQLEECEYQRSGIREGRGRFINVEMSGIT